MEGRRESILKAAMQCVRTCGLEGVRIQHIGKRAGTVTSNIYAYFDSKDDLMRACFDHVDRQIARIFDRVSPDPERLAVDPEGEIRALWTAYYRWLVAHPNETVFYHRYRDGADFARREDPRARDYFGSFADILRLFQTQYHIFDRVDQHILWLHVLNGTVLYAKYVVEGNLPDTPETEESVFRLIMNGLRGLLSEPGPGEREEKK